MDHNKVITATAKKALSPLGLRRQRQSRIWYDDHGWWAIVVEFQPSAWERGSYLNIGLSWMLYERSSWAFDIGHREQDFKRASDEDQFEAAMDNVAAYAARRVLEYRDRFSSLDQMRAHYRDLGDGSWDDYYAGVLAGLSGDRETAEQRLSLVIDAPARVTWHRALQFRCRDLVRLLAQPRSFRDSILGIVLRCRSARCLAEMPVDEIALP